MPEDHMDNVFRGQGLICAPVMPAASIVFVSICSAAQLKTSREAVTAMLHMQRSLFRMNPFYSSFF